MEVLGTVIGTAIQGQIVGMANAPCVPTLVDVTLNGNESNATSLLTGSEVNSTHPVISLDHTVGHTHTPLFLSLSLRHTHSFAVFSRSCIADPVICLLAVENRLHDRFWNHLWHLRPVCHRAVLRREREER